jgi:hypothetical protein
MPYIGQRRKLRPGFRRPPVVVVCSGIRYIFNEGHVSHGAGAEMGDTTPMREPQRGLTFEDVWAAMMETNRKMQETDRRMQETDRKMQETDRKMQETDRKIGELGNRFGELAEHLVTPNIAEKFRALGYAFTRAGPDVEFFGPDGKALTEVDVWLENGEFAMAVEVTSRLREQDVDHHAGRKALLRRYLDERGDTRKLLGAVAGAIVNAAVEQYALGQGFYVIEQSGDTVKIEAPEGFEPRMW